MTQLIAEIPQEEDPGVLIHALEQEARWFDLGILASLGGIAVIGILLVLVGMV